MKEKKLKINNSYESEFSSNSALSVLENSACENVSFDGVFLNLPEMLRPRLYEVTTNADEYVFEHENTEEKSRIATETVHSSQESDFLGYSDSESTPALCNFKSLCALEEEYTYNESENYLFKSDQMCSQLKKKPTRSIDHLSPYENSCNAVDVRLSVDNSRNNSQELSFNGKINTYSSNNTEQDSIGSIEKRDYVNLDSKNFVSSKINAQSPDVFGDLIDSDTNKVDSEPMYNILEQQANELAGDVFQKEQELLKRIQLSLSGVPPPPSVTILQIDLFQQVINNKENILEFFGSLKSVKEGTCKRELIFTPTHTTEDIKSIEWPQILTARHHGLSYNLSTVSEKIELLCLSVLERYIGAETASSFQTSPSSSKKRNTRLKMLTQSPGSRLSHLAKRRSVFSSANLQQNSQKSQKNKTGSMQILLDTKRAEKRRRLKVITPQKYLEKKKCVRNTPSSSARKRLFQIENSKAGPSRETSKRALFQSPPQQKISTKPSIKPEIANRVEKSKRALFSPEKPSALTCLRNEMAKRKREDDDSIENSCKIFKEESNLENLTPRSLKIKSLSFCNGSGNRGSSNTISGKSLIRANSDTVFCSNQLSESHKKKLLWAVSQALQTKQIHVQHHSFKQYASVLARVVKRLFLENYQKSSSTSDTMLKLAKKHVFWVMQGKSADDIYTQEKSKMSQDKSQKLTGYVGPEEYERYRNTLKRTESQNLFSEGSVDSFNLSLSLSVKSAKNLGSLTQCSQDSLLTRASCVSPVKFVQSKPSQNSSSKNNLGGFALRENIDCEARRSAQKSFTGIDQKNVSPYSDKVRSSVKKQISNFLDVNAKKAKRQISFES